MAVCVCCNFIAVIDYNLLQEVKKLIFYRRNDILYTYCIHKHLICALRSIKQYDFRPVSRSIYGVCGLKLYQLYAWYHATGPI